MPGPIRITFDSNVWQIVMCPDDFPDEPMLASFKAIREAIKGGIALGYLSESIFTLEAVMRKHRQDYFAANRLKTECEVIPHPGNQIQIRVKLGPDPGRAVRNNPYLDRYLAAARALNVKLLRCNRLAGVQNADLVPTDYAPVDQLQFTSQNEKTGECCRQIEARQAERALLVGIAEKYSQNGHWIDGLARAPKSEARSIADAVAEWADGDSVAAHIGYQNDLFCTRDMATGAGPASVFSQINRSWLNQTYGVVFVRPEELAKRLQTL